MSKVLVDANLSWQTARFLVDMFGFDVLHAGEILGEGTPDERVIALAKQQQRVVLTLDREFGEVYYPRERGALGVILLRLEDETRPSVEKVLAAFFSGRLTGVKPAEVVLTGSLVVVEEQRAYLGPSGYGAETNEAA